MQNLRLKDDQSKIVQAYSVLDSISSAGSGSTGSGSTGGGGGGGLATINVVVDGRTVDLQATPEIIQAFKQSLGYSLFGRPTDQQDVTFSRNDVAKSLHVDSNALDGLVSSKGGAGADRFTMDDIMPWVASHTDLSRDLHAS